MVACSSQPLLESWSWHIGSNIELTAADGHQLGAYAAESSGSALGAVVVVQEIFGVNRHIRSVADDYAGQGFWAIAPALFDRVEPNLELDYNTTDASRGMRNANQIGMGNALKDVAAAITHAGSALRGKKVGVVGYCFGGTLAWLAATRLNPRAVVCYYGGRIAQYAAEIPRCPVMLHFGSKDPHIPSSEIEKIQRAHPELRVFLYDAGHGFNCDQRKDYAPQAATLARQRTLEFFRKHLVEE
jgi:carboxymethylenebutenolidase